MHYASLVHAATTRWEAILGSIHADSISGAGAIGHDHNGSELKAGSPSRDTMHQDAVQMQCGRSAGAAAGLASMQRQGSRKSDDQAASQTFKLRQARVVCVRGATCSEDSS